MVSLGNDVYMYLNIIVTCFNAFSTLYEYLDWSPHINHLSHKLVKANAMLCKLRHYENEATIKSIYYAIFHSRLSYVCTALGQNLNPNHRINLLQKKAMRIINFARYDAHILPVFAELNIVKYSIF